MTGPVRLLARTLYAVAASLTGVVSAVLPPGQSKTSIALRARRGIRRRYATWAMEKRDISRKLLWLHAPSVGEGLMARPVLQMMRDRHKDTQLAYTFFSPSAEEFSRTLDVDFRDYLPFDTAGETRAALDALAPTALVFSKLDLWPELVRQAKARGVRVGMISATLSAASGRRGVVARMLLSDAYGLLDAVGAIDAADAERLVELGVRREVIEVTGDTGFDTVWQRALHVKRDAGLLHRLVSDRPTVVAGSTWPADEGPLLEGIQRARARVPDLRVIIAPHEPTQSHLEPIERWASTSRLTLARIDDQRAATSDVALVDRVGVLSELYALAGAAFVGGGFHDKGLHSVLEPAAFGAPIMFGPRHDRRDATMLLAADGARVVASALDVERALMDWFGGDDSLRARQGANARDVVQRGTGAAERSLSLVERLLSP